MPSLVLQLSLCIGSGACFTLVVWRNQSIPLTAVEPVMCLPCVSARTEAAGDESVLSGFAGMSSTSRCALLSKLRLLSPRSPASVSCHHGARLPVHAETWIQSIELGSD